MYWINGASIVLKRSFNTCWMLWSVLLQHSLLPIILSSAGSAWKPRSTLKTSRHKRKVSTQYSMLGTKLLRLLYVYIHSSKHIHICIYLLSPNISLITSLVHFGLPLPQPLSLYTSLNPCTTEVSLNLNPYILYHSQT